MSDVVGSLRKALRATGTPVKTIARETKLNPLTVNRVMFGDTKNPHGVTLDKLAAWLGKRWELGDGPDTPETVKRKLETIPRLSVWLRQ